MKSKISVPTIPVSEAVDRVKRFRDQLINQVPEANIPRAVFIPIDDLLAIINNYDAVDANGVEINSLSGVRAYFAVKDTDMDLADDITAVIVPVDKLGKDIVQQGKGDGEGDDEPSSIYDFTQPCPDKCDPTSPLFIE
jgi:hypothetical protein